MKMSQMFKTTLAAAMIMALAVTAGCGGGGDKKSAGSEKVTLKLAHNLPTAHPLAQGMEAFNKKLTEKSNGTITLNIYPSGQQCGQLLFRQWKFSTYRFCSQVMKKSIMPSMEAWVIN